MEIGNLIEEFQDWLAALPAEFAFLLALPFLVAAAGLLRYAIDRKRREPREQHQQYQQRERERGHKHSQHRRWSRVH